jgi:electron transport complex protein RnfC
MSANPSLFRFHGGLHLDGHKHESLVQPLQQASVPDRLILRMSQHIGEPNSPLVKVGDRVKRGQLLAASSKFVSAPVHAPSAGTIVAIENRSIAHPSGQQAECFIIKTDPNEGPLEFDQRGSILMKKSDDESQRDSLLHEIKQAGIVGLGGAVFPTAAKLATAIQHDIHTLIINGAECEPYITCDDILMQYSAAEILRGIAILKTILKPQKILIGIEDNKPKAILAMRDALAESNLQNTDVISVPSIYPSGGEKQLIKLLTGKEVHSGQLSFEVGIFCQNVGTCSAISHAVEHHQPLISRVVTVSGPGVHNPGNWITRLGTPISHLIGLAGGYKVKRPKLVMGGPMMGFTLKNDQIPIVKAANSILVLDQDDQPVEQQCIRCGQCAEVCPANLLPQQLYWHSRARQFDETEAYNLFDCIECGCCAAVCPSHIPLVQYYRFAKSEIWDQRQKTWKADLSRKRHEFREARLLKQKQKDELRRQQKREALAKKKTATTATADAAQSAGTDKSADAIKAALERVKARKNPAQSAVSRNTTNLTPEQQRQIDEADARRKKLKNNNS